VTGHSFKMVNPAARIVGRAVCTNCGLMRLRNLLTDWCVEKGCEYSEHPGYEGALRTLPARHRESEARP
jgi:hypothetical protein